MAFTTKPAEIPEWATSDVVNGVTGQNNVVEPPAAKKLSGWAWQEKPARNWWNWMQRFNYLWINYFNQFFSTTHQFKIDEIIENTTNNGVDIEGVHFEDDIITVDTINELTTNNGVDIEGVHFEDNAINGTYHIYTQAQFNTVIERVAANQYKVNDSIVALIINNLSGGYQMSSVLSGGDTWGYIETNNCVSIEFINGSFIDFENERGYIEINTDGCYIKNGDTQGTGTVASAITQSWLLNASRVTFDNCKCSNRLSNVDMVGFQGSGTALHNLTSKYINCSAYSLNGTDKIYGFINCMNISNALAYDLDSSTGSDDCAGFRLCYQVSSCVAYSIDSGAGNAIGFSACDQITSSIALQLDSVSGDVYGFASSSTITSCKAEDLDAGGAGDCYGFGSNNRISGCFATDIDSDSGDAIGFFNENVISACTATSITSASGTAEGFRGIEYGSSLWTSEAVNSSNDWVDTVDAQITNKVSTPSVWT